MRSVCVGVGVGPNEAGVDELAFQCVCAVRLAASVLELTDLGTGIYGAVFAVAPVVRRPLLRPALICYAGRRARNRNTSVFALYLQHFEPDAL